MDASVNYAQSGYAQSGYADTTFGAAPAGSFVGSQIGHAGPPTVAVQDQQGYQEFVVRVPATEVSQYIQGPPQYRTQMIPGRVVEQIVREVVPGPTQTVQEVVPGPVTYRDEKVEVPGPVTERIERVEVAGPVYEHIEKEFVPGPEVVREVTVEVAGPVVEKIVKVDVPGPVIKRAVPGQQITVPGPVRIIPRPVPVPREVIREVHVPRQVVQTVAVPVMLPGPTRHVLVKRVNKADAEKNAKLRAELAHLVATRGHAAVAPQVTQFQFLASRPIDHAPVTPVVIPQQFEQASYAPQYASYGAAPQYAAAPQQYGAAPYGYGAAPYGYGAPQQF
eukprot:c9045_g1_i1.p2 GENE.c9045_g1_i1~~c9045_g1_i1.p2  ORF type:complete len:334 (+),score=31.27 c9045_g1_i1:40-1041(+)